MTKTNTAIVEADDSVVETKITKAEAIELLIGELNTTLAKERRGADAELERARKALRAFRFEDVTAMFKDAEVKIGEYSGRVTIEIETRVGVNDRRLPAGVRAAVQAEIDAEKAVRKIRDRQSELTENRTRIKNEMLRTILEATPAGRRFLGQLSDLRVKIERRQLVGSNG